MTIAAQHVRAAINHLRSTDPRWREIIRQVGPFSVRLERDPVTWLTWHLQRRSLLEWVGSNTAPVEPLSAAQHDFQAELRSAIASGQIDLSRPTIDEHGPARCLPLAQLLQRFDSRLLPHFLFYCWGDLDQWPAEDPLLARCVAHVWSAPDGSPIGHGNVPPHPLPTASNWPVDTWAPFRSIAAWYLARWAQLNGPSIDR